jgi:hypothetical protein
MDEWMDSASGVRFARYSERVVHLIYLGLRKLIGERVMEIKHVRSAGGKAGAKESKERDQPPSKPITILNPENPSRDCPPQPVGVSCLPIDKQHNQTLTISKIIKSRYQYPVGLDLYSEKYKGTFRESSRSRRCDMLSDSVEVPATSINPTRLSP